MQLTKHFTLEEFNKEKLCVSDYILHNLRNLALFLETVRLSYGLPIRITSGFRSAKHNKEVGGVPDSLHLIGKAVDIQPIQDKDFQALAFHICKFLPPEAKYYYEIHPKKNYIHLQFGTKDSSKLDLLPYFPFRRE